MFRQDIDAAIRRINDWEATLATRALAADRLNKRLRALRAPGSDPDAVAVATVDHAGQLVDLRFSEPASAMPLPSLAAAVLAAYGQARTAVAQLVQQTVAESGAGDAG